MAQSIKNPPAMQETACNAGELGSIPDSGSSPGEGNGNPLQYSCQGHPMDGGAWQTSSSRALIYMPVIPSLQLYLRLYGYSLDLDSQLPIYPKAFLGDRLHAFEIQQILLYL